MSDELKSILIGLTGLYIVTIIAFVLTVTHRQIQHDNKKIYKLTNYFLIGITVQCFHFIEEFLTGFQIRFPGYFDLSACSDDFFASINISWIAIWLVSVIGIRRNFKPAFFPWWFFTVGMVLNLIGHPLLALAHSGYFPGLITSPLVGIIGIKLLTKLIELKSENVK